MLQFLFYAFILLVLFLWIFLLHFKRPPAIAISAPPSAGGLQAAAIEALPSFKFGAGGLELPSNYSGWSDCVVCLGPFEDDETLRLMPDCGHVFHSFCVDAWLRYRATCPCCRAAVLPPPAGDGSGVPALLEDAC